MEVVQLIFNVVVLLYIVTTMLVAGLVTTYGMLNATFHRVPLVLLVLLANIVLMPLVGWGLGTILALSTASFTALVMLACSPGGPFGAKMAMIQKGDVTAGASMQVMLAAIGSVTFPITLSFILTTSGQGGDVTINVSQLVMTVVVLQLIPFGMGLFLRHEMPEFSDEIQPSTLKISNLTLVIVLAGCVLGSWQAIVDLITTASLLAGLLLAALGVIIGYAVSTGPRETRYTMSTIAPIRNTGPIFAAIGISFDGSTEILGAVVAQLMMGLIVVFVTVAIIGRLKKQAAIGAGSA